MEYGLDVQKNEFVIVTKKEEEILKFITEAQISGNYFYIHDACKEFGLGEDAIAKRLRNLRKKGVIDHERVGRTEWVYYFRIPTEQIRLRKSYKPIFFDPNFSDPNFSSDPSFFCYCKPNDVTCVPENANQYFKCSSNGNTNEDIKCGDTPSDPDDSNFDPDNSAPDPYFSVPDPSSINLGSLDFFDPPPNIKLISDLNIIPKIVNNTNIEYNSSFNWDLYIDFNTTISKFVVNLFYDCKYEHQINDRWFKVLNEIAKENNIEFEDMLEINEKFYNCAGRLKVRGIPEECFYQGFWENGRKQSCLMAKMYSDLKKAIADIRAKGKKRARPKKNSQVDGVERSGNFWMAKHKLLPLEEWTVWDFQVHWNEGLKKRKYPWKRWEGAERGAFKGVLLKRWDHEHIKYLMDFMLDDWESIKEQYPWMAKRNSGQKVQYTGTPSIWHLINHPEEIEQACFDRDMDKYYDENPSEAPINHKPGGGTLTDEEVEAKLWQQACDEWEEHKDENDGLGRVDWDNAWNAEYEWNDELSDYMTKVLPPDAGWDDYIRVEKEWRAMKKAEKEAAARERRKVDSVERQAEAYFNRLSDAGKEDYIEQCLRWTEFMVNRN